MKLRYLFSSILASALCFTACTEKMTGSFGNISLDKTFISIAETGGEASVTINASEDWAFVKDATWPEVVTFNNDLSGKQYKETQDFFGNMTNPAGHIKSKTPSWLSVSALSGTAGETKITFSAEANAGGREITVALVCGRNKQYITVRQGSLEASSASCAEIIAGPDGKTYRTKGVCTSIVQTTYGNWYLNDGTGEVYIYGTLDAKGAEKNFASLNIEVGDIVELEGPKTTYNSTVELVNVTVLKITKSLAKLETESKTVGKDGGNMQVKVSYKGKNFGHSIPEEFREWISVASISHISGIASKLEPNPADTAVIDIKVHPNAGGNRKGSIDFTSGNSKVSYEFLQEGSIIAASVAEFLKAEKSETLYRVTGVISSINASSKYHNAEIYLMGGLGEKVLLYRAKCEDGNIEDLGLKVGDIATFLGKRSSYNDTPQMAEGGIYESHQHFDTLSIADFLSAEISDTKYIVSGTITAIKDLSESYNNVGITINDGVSEVYCHRVTTIEKSSNVTKLDLQVGGKITIAGPRGEYKGSAQMAQGGMILFYEAPAAK